MADLEDNRSMATPMVIEPLLANWLVITFVCLFLCRLLEVVVKNPGARSPFQSALVWGDPACHLGRPILSRSECLRFQFPH
jgi:hypothetical protein